MLWTILLIVNKKSLSLSAWICSRFPNNAYILVLFTIAQTFNARFLLHSEHLSETWGIISSTFFPLVSSSCSWISCALWHRYSSHILTWLYPTKFLLCQLSCNFDLALSVLAPLCLFRYSLHQSRTSVVLFSFFFLQWLFFKESQFKLFQLFWLVQCGSHLSGHACHQPDRIF